MGAKQPTHKVRDSVISYIQNFKNTPHAVSKSALTKILKKKNERR